MYLKYKMQNTFRNEIKYKIQTAYQIFQIIKYLYLIYFTTLIRLKKC